MIAKKIKILLTQLALFFILGSTSGKTPYNPTHADPFLEPWRWKSYAGLEGASTTCMLQAHDKTIWFGTENGLIHYDGINWVNFGTENNIYGEQITSICQDQKGSIYAGSYSGISKFNGIEWQKFFPFDSVYWPVYHLTTNNKGDIWAGTAFGALRISDEVFYFICHPATSRSN
ncbi:MAG: hypothetical protein HC896_01325 [Bacteroidales bacterium]|nr:hypothetical protein [Bacteroidales bacterium]